MVFLKISEPIRAGVRDNTLLMESGGRIRAFAYLTADKAELYRAIMRTFMDAKERFALHLRPADIFAELNSSPSSHVDAGSIDAELNQLCEWGNLEARPDTADVSTVDDFLRKRYLYQLSVVGEAAERAVMTFEESIQQPGELQTTALADICNLLLELETLTKADEPDEGKLHVILISLRARFDELTRRAQMFMSGLQRRIDLQAFDLEDFLAYKQRLLDYIERFIQELIIASAEIATILCRIERDKADRFLSVVAARELANAIEQHSNDIDQSRLKWQQRWNGLRDWFISRNGAPSHAEVLRSRALSAIPALLGAIANINDRRITRIDRSNDLRTLARWFATTETDADAHRLWRAAFALNPARHLSTNSETLDAYEAAQTSPGTTWFAAPPMRVSIRLRSTGHHSRGRRISVVADHTGQKEELAQLAAEEAAQIESAQKKLATNGRIKLSEIGTLNRREFDLFLDLLGEALTTKFSPEVPVETVSSDGLLRIILEPVEPPGTAVIVTSDGTLAGPDHFITVVPVFTKIRETEVRRHVTVT